MLCCFSYFLQEPQSSADQCSSLFNPQMYSTLVLYATLLAIVCGRERHKERRGCLGHCNGGEQIYITKDTNLKDHSQWLRRKGALTASPFQRLQTPFGKRSSRIWCLHTAMIWKACRQPQTVEPDDHEDSRACGGV